MIKLIVGLGNPGRQYARTRHNAGMLLVETARQRLGGGDWRSWRGCRLAELPVGARTTSLLMSASYMNESGGAVAEFVHFMKKITPQEILVAHDDLDLPFGKVQLKFGGTAGGHNGVTSVIHHLGTVDFWRLRIGIGRPPEPGPTVTDYVLSPFTADEERRLSNIIDASVTFLLDSIPKDPLLGGSILVQ